MITPNSETKAIFGQAIEFDRGAARTAFLDRACEGNRPLRKEIEELISAWEGAGDFLNQSAAAAVIAWQTIRARQAEPIVEAERDGSALQQRRSTQTGHVG